MSGGAEIIILAGVNGAGKSSIGGAALRQAGLESFNPDEVAKRIRTALPALGVADASARAWEEGRRLLDRALERRERFSVETTLGGQTIAGLLLKASNLGLPVRVWYVGLASPELHIERVHARVARGGHDIPEELIRSRFQASRVNLVRLIPHLAELKVYDNSAPGDPQAGETPAPFLILHFERGRLIAMCPVADVPAWAKPIAAAVLRLVD